MNRKDSSTIHPTLIEFAGISEVAETTTHLLALALHQANRSENTSVAELGEVEHYVLQRARDYLSSVREGFVLSLRASSIRDRIELRYLLDRVLTDWDQLSRELGLDEEVTPLPDTRNSQSESAGDSLQIPPADKCESPCMEQVRQQLLAYGMAVIAMGFLPRLPSKQVTFPQSYGKPPTYADIPVPHTPGEVLWRIEELEKTVWQIMSRDLGELVQRRYGPVRRTYGFFETSAWLSMREAQRFGIKKSKSSPMRF